MQNTETLNFAGSEIEKNLVGTYLLKLSSKKKNLRQEIQNAEKQEIAAKYLELVQVRGSDIENDMIVRYDGNSPFRRIRIVSIKKLSQFTGSKFPGYREAVCDMALVYKIVGESRKTKEWWINSGHWLWVEQKSIK